MKGQYCYEGIKQKVCERRQDEVHHSSNVPCFTLTMCLSLPSVTQPGGAPKEKPRRQSLLPLLCSVACSLKIDVRGVNTSSLICLFDFDLFYSDPLNKNNYSPFSFHTVLRCKNDPSVSLLCKVISSERSLYKKKITLTQ